MIPHELLQDLSKLVCSSRNDKIEDLFLKLVKAQEVEADRFSSWIEKNKNNKALKRSLSEPNVLDALSFAHENKNITPPNGWLGSLMGKNNVYMTIYSCFYRLLQEGKHTDSLSSISKMLFEFSRLREDTWFTDSKIDGDLTIVHNHYQDFLNREHNKTYDDHMLPASKVKVSEKTKFRRLFKRLLKGFTDDIVAGIGDYKDLLYIQSLIKGGNLPNSEELFTFLPNDPDPKIFKWKDQLLRKAIVFAKRENYDTAFFELRKQALNNVSTLSSIPLNFEQEDKEEVDYSSFMNDNKEDEAWEGVERKPETVDPYFIRKTEYIMLISLLLRDLFEKCK